jgi:hypothetical protein
MKSVIQTGTVTPVPAAISRKFELAYSDNGIVTLRVNGWHALLFHPDGTVNTCAYCDRERTGLNVDAEDRLIVTHAE